MDEYGKKELLCFYDRHLRDFGDSPQALRWTPEGQEARYSAFLSIAGNLNGKSVLDFGCGKGDFYGFMRARGIDASYCGVDVNASLIGLASEKYPRADFRVVDIEEERLDGRFDVIIACGVFNLRIGGIKESMENVLKLLFDRCGQEMHFNALSSYAVQRDVELFFVSPEELLKFALKSLSLKVTLRHDLVRGDVFVSVFR